jgi:hypothetical protein
MPKKSSSIDVQKPLVQEIVSAIQSVVGVSPVGLHEPNFVGNECQIPLTTFKRVESII